MESDTTVTTTRDRRVYQNDCGAVVAECWLSFTRGWIARTYLSPDEWEQAGGLNAETADRICTTHASNF